MVRYQQPFWGYEIEMPDGWFHKTIEGIEAFTQNKAALQPDYIGPQSGQILIRGEWNALNKDIEPLWKQHITRTSIMLGAKNLGSSPWVLPAGRGFEAEIFLPKKTDQRLWTGILENQARILQLMVVHRIEERSVFEPQATQLISSLCFVRKVDSVNMDKTGLPLPTCFNPVDPKIILPDLRDSTNWKAYKGPANLGALQAFYDRELSIYGWSIKEFIPFPSTSDLGFARITIFKRDVKLILGLMPDKENEENGWIVIKQ